MTDAEIELACWGIDDAPDVASPDEQDEVPAECERNGCDFGGAMVKVGDRWVCTACEEAEYEDYATTEADWLALHMDMEEDRAREEAW